MHSKKINGMPNEDKPNTLPLYSQIYIYIYKQKNRMIQIGEFIVM